MTVQQVITAAAIDAKILQAGETLNDDENADALAILNLQADAWNIERLNVYTIGNATYAVLAATAAITIGPSPNSLLIVPTIVAPRPVRVVSAGTYGSDFLRNPLEIVSAARWAAIVEKTAQAIAPRFLYCDYAYPVATIYLNPVPKLACTLDLFTWNQIAQFAALTSTFDMPPGFLAAFRANLALGLATNFGAPLTQDLINNAQLTKAAIQRLDVPPDPPANVQDAAQMPQSPQQQQMPARPPGR